MRNAAIVVLMFLVTVPVFGDQSTPNPQFNARFGALRDRKPNDSYGRLFNAQQELNKAIAAAQATAKPTVVCGMLVIPADPKIDPKMAITPKKDGVEPTIRAIVPPICQAGQ